MACNGPLAGLPKLSSIPEAHPMWADTQSGKGYGTARAIDVSYSTTFVPDSPYQVSVKVYETPVMRMYGSMGNAPAVYGKPEKKQETMAQEPETQYDPLAAQVSMLQANLAYQKAARAAKPQDDYSTQSINKRVLHERRDNIRNQLEALLAEEHKHEHIA